MQSIGVTLKNLRESGRLLLEDVAKHTNIDVTLLSRIENGKRLPTKEQINLLCKYYHIEQDEIVVQWLSDKIISEMEGEDENLTISAIKIAAEKMKANSNGRNVFPVQPNNKPVAVQSIRKLANKVIQGDCLEVMKIIPDKTIDMILCDLPYGTTRNKWDSVIDLNRLWSEYERIIKDDGVIALTSQGVFTAKLISSNEKLFKYKIVWIKSKPTNFLNAKKQPLRKHEDVCVFYKKSPMYNPQMTEGDPYDKGVRKNQCTGSYGNFNTAHVKSNGERYPNDVVFYDDTPVDDYVYVKTAETEGPVLHPTQKPVELGRYLIRTYTKPGDIVLDNACGSGSFLVSALLENRQFIGIEKNEYALLHKADPIDYVDISIHRIKETLKKNEITETTLKSFKEPILKYHKVVIKTNN